jgi:hypothetical protein
MHPVPDVDYGRRVENRSRKCERGCPRNWTTNSGDGKPIDCEPEHHACQEEGRNYEHSGPVTPNVLFSRAGRAQNPEAPLTGHGVGCNNGLERYSKLYSRKVHDPFEKFSLVLVVVIGL